MKEIKKLSLLCVPSKKGMDVFMKRVVAFSIIIICVCCILCTAKGTSYAYERNTKPNNIESKNSNSKVSKDLREEQNMGFIILKAVGISFIISTVMCVIIISKHKPVRVAKTANNYLNENKVNITKRDDIFIRSTVDKQLR